MSGLWTYLIQNRSDILGWTGPTLWLATVPLVAGLLISLPVGWAAFRSRWVALPVLPLARVLYTVPSLVMFLVLPDILGTKILDPVNVGVALTLYTVALLVPTVVDGLGSVSRELLAAASAMGQSGRQRLLAIHLPLALPVIAAGTRVAAVSNVALISVASVIGTAQLGQLFVTGTNLGNLSAIVLGLIFFLLLALVLDLVVVALTRRATPWLRLGRS